MHRRRDTSGRPRFDDGAPVPCARPANPGVRRFTCRCAVWVAGAVVTALVVAAPAASAPPPTPSIPRAALWIEVSANLQVLADRAATRDMVRRAKAAGIDTLIPEAKNAWGFVIYESAIAPHIRTSPVPRHGYPAPARWFPQNVDVLRMLIDEAHGVGLRVHVAVNAFGEGLRLAPGGPVVGTLARHPEWESLQLQPGGAGQVVPSSRVETIAFANPAHPEVALYELAILWEVLTQYDVDGLVLDRARFPGLAADLSDLSRAQFERVLGRAVAAWPQDVLTVASAGPTPGRLFGEWVAWRASVVQSYTRAASRLARQLRPGAPIAMYVGGWYPTIYEVGQNWAHPDAPRLFPFWTPAWAQASLAPHLDYLMVGLYYRPLSGLGALAGGTAWWRSVGGGAVMARQVVGGLPVLGTLWPAVYGRSPEQTEAAVQMVLRTAEGVALFDLSDLDSGGLWEAVGRRLRTLQP